MTLACLGLSYWAEINNNNLGKGDMLRWYLTPYISFHIFIISYVNFEIFPNNALFKIEFEMKVLQLNLFSENVFFRLYSNHYKQFARQSEIAIFLAKEDKRRYESFVLLVHWLFDRLISFTFLRGSVFTSRSRFKNNAYLLGIWNRYVLILPLVNLFALVH